MPAERMQGPSSLARVVLRVLFGLLVACRASTAGAHQLDEYVGVTHVEIERDRIRILLSLTPGSEIADRVISAIDTDRNGTFSDAEIQHYAHTILAGMNVAVDAAEMAPRLVDVGAPSPDNLRTGQAIIRLTLDVTPPSQRAGPHSVVVTDANAVLTVIVANALVPPDPSVRILRQTRDRYQRQIEIAYDIEPSASSGWVIVGLIVVAVAGGLLFRRHRRRVAGGTPA